MAQRKPTKKYYFSVEGETEQWYLKWLQDSINEKEEAAYKVTLDCPVQKNPIHVKEFTETMDNMKAAKSLGKQINYQFGYSNLTFDLWIVLHMADCNAFISHRKNYLAPLNRAYDEHFESMDEYDYGT